MSLLFPVVILFSVVQVLGYWYVDKRQLAKGRLKTLLVIIFLYILLALVIPMAPDGEYMTSSNWPGSQVPNAAAPAGPGPGWSNPEPCYNANGCLNA